jgi:site-specific DNA-cytosine methylase
MDAHDFLKLIRAGAWRPQKPIRLLVADPPCTPWSRAGKRQGELDPRDCLRLTCDLIRELGPAMYLIGNVPGLDDGPNLHITQKHIGALTDAGYCSADFARLDAVNYGVPQHRVRPFWFGHKDGPCIQWPAPTHGDPDDLVGQYTLPGVDALIPWVSCRQALGHLPPDELGRPVRLRHRAQNSVQPGSVPERPARVIGTSNLSDGNVLLGENQPRAKKRGGKNHGVSQGERVQEANQPADTVTKALHHTIIEQDGDTRQFVEVGGHLVPLAGEGKAKGRKRDIGVSQANRTGDFNKPSAVVTTKVARKGVGAHATITLQTENRRYLTTSSKPGKVITRNTHGDGSILVNDRHADEPAPTMGAKIRGQSAQVLVTSNHPAIDSSDPSTTVRGGGHGHSAPHIVVTSKHPASPHEAPAMTVRGSDGEGANRALEWPWPQPATAIQRDERLAPPGHHDERLAPPGHHDEWSIMSMPDAVVISEKAAAILQGFPEKWVFVGETKKARWSQIGQAMPPPLAHAVATSVRHQWQRTLEAKGDNLGWLCDLVDEAGGVMRYHGQPISEADLRGEVTDSATRRMADALVAVLPSVAELDDLNDHICSSKATEACSGCKEMGADVPDLVLTNAGIVEAP